MASPDPDSPADGNTEAEHLVNTMTSRVPLKGDSDTAGKFKSELDASETGLRSSDCPRDRADVTDESCSSKLSPKVDENSWVLSKIKKLQDELVKMETLASQVEKLEKVEKHWDEEFERFGSDAVQRTWAEVQGKRAQSFVKDTTAFALSREWVHESEDSFIRHMMERQDFDKELTQRRAHWEARKGITHTRADKLQNPIRPQDDPFRPYSIPTFLDLLSPEAQFNETAEAQGYDLKERQLRCQIHDVVRNKYSAFVVWKQQSNENLEFTEPDPRLNHLWPRPMATYVPWDNFINNSPNNAFFSKERQHLFALDVLDGEPDLKVPVTFDNPVTICPPIAVPRLVHGHVPERIRLNGPQFIHTFGQIFHSPAFPDPKRLPAQVTLLQPHRLLIYHEKEIRDRYNTLKERFAVPSDCEDTSSEGISQAPEHQDDAGLEQREVTDAGVRASQNSGTGAEASDQERAATQNDRANERRQASKGERGGLGPPRSRFADSKTAMDYLGCLIDFMDSTISARRKYVQSMECRKVHFRDLWYLFNPGDEVIRRDGRQVYKVIKVVNPTHRESRRGILDYDDIKDKSRYFLLSCVYVDFDGRKIGPVPTTFVIKTFAGQRTVESLEVYPLRLYHPTSTSSQNAKNPSVSSGPQTLRQELIKRGKKFFQAACMKLEHTFYEGPTADGDEISSQVVVDFETALSSDNTFNQNSKPRIKPLLGDVDDSHSTSSASDNHAQCADLCCFRQYICDDSFVETRRAHEYINSLLPKTFAKLPPVAIYPRDLEDTTGDNALTDDEFLLMSCRVFAFVLKTRKWGEVSFFFFPFLFFFVSLFSGFFPSYKKGSIYSIQYHSEPASSP